ncbi:MAG: Mur ligase family protein [Marinilabiliales bacterium]|nr:Mur ligase family protein [Marinilabiliales bacterium]
MTGYFGHPHTKFRSVHVAGTNGKGSVSHMIASVLQEAGYRTGLYTSPHLKDFRERIRVDGQMMGEEDVVSFVGTHDELIRRVQPSFFELTVAMAFDYFARMNVDVAVIEVGMGGRLDSTNIITPVLSVITNIGHDHMEFLGDTLAAVAGEKAGIIKEGVPVVIGETQPETRSVFQSRAEADECDPCICRQGLPLQAGKALFEQCNEEVHGHRSP